MEQAGTLSLYPHTGCPGLHEANEDHGFGQTSRHSANGQRLPQDKILILRVEFPGLLPPHLLGLIAHADNKEAATLSLSALTKYYGANEYPGIRVDFKSHGQWPTHTTRLTATAFEEEDF